MLGILQPCWNTQCHTTYTEILPKVYTKSSDYETSSGLPEISESPETVRFLWC